MEVPRTLCIVLDKPLTLGDRSWDCLDLHEPRVSMIKAAAEILGAQPTKVSVVDAQVDLVSRVTGIPVKVLEDLPSLVLEDAAAFMASYEEDARRKPDTEPDLSPSLFIELAEAVETERGTQTSMSLRPPTVRERKRAESHLSRMITVSSLLAHEIALVEAVSGWQHVQVLKMPIGPFAQAADYLTGFFQRGRATGRSSRPS